MKVGGVSAMGIRISYTGLTITKSPYPWFLSWNL
jgi:hypothetical protein